MTWLADKPQLEATDWADAVTIRWYEWCQEHPHVSEGEKRGKLRSLISNCLIDDRKTTVQVWLGLERMRA